ncbi:hydrogenase nickel incorporation protein HypB [Gelidibacter salicanalis]|uniref:Hydrogenase nickel incorporation protein HypB n=1 Tax=Gelidibacter salicanalis TaxID=291193 RepID=A0A934KVC1_9FLAO|nr:hydrogenase nickel incorporation protein HypB [Gelidibacter salicanalis]MBJ7882011.1 hydrogenase nickel incorporation protein HypB [Gelidibacter salicanalis]
MNTTKPKSSRITAGSVDTEHVSLNLLRANDFVAQKIREQLKDILVINVCSSPGSGKTTLMQKTGELLKGKLKMSVLVADPETDRDAVRMKESGINALQIVTGGICHIESQMILQAIDLIDLEGTDVLFIENVGNLMCPSSFDLGEDYRVTLISTTEGDDKPRKYPKMFLTSELMLISKLDLLPYLPFSVEAVTEDARTVNPDIDVLEISSLKDTGLDAWIQWIQTKLEEKKNKNNYK